MQNIFDERCLLHATDRARLHGRPFDTFEIPSRTEKILRALKGEQIGPLLSATDHGRDPFIAVHDIDYLEFLETAYSRHIPKLEEDAPLLPEDFTVRNPRNKPAPSRLWRGYYALDTFSPILSKTWESSYWSAQCALTAVDLILAGERNAYALCRPPGHHAASNLYGGFCYLNNAAIAARYLQKQVNGLARVAILDIDFHHGNGTQEIFYDDASVFYCSLHGDPSVSFPDYWGTALEKGDGLGLGYNDNHPLPHGMDGKTYLRVLNEALAELQAFEPEYLIVSAGFDIVEGDPYGGFTLTRKDLIQIGKQIASLKFRTIIVQEGGYLIESLGEDVVAFLGAFS